MAKVFLEADFSASIINELISKREIPETIRSKNKYIGQFAKIQKRQLKGKGRLGKTWEKPFLSIKRQPFSW